MPDFWQYAFLQCTFRLCSFVQCVILQYVNFVMWLFGNVEFEDQWLILYVIVKQIHIVQDVIT